MDCADRRHVREGPEALKILSVNVGLLREVEWHHRRVLTSIWKTPVEGRVHVGWLDLDGDQQSDLSVHGGKDKAVYLYPSEHYPYWRDQLPGVDLPPGAFGENLTIDGLLEPDVRIGDRFRIGSAEFVVTQPRLPCFKLGIRLGRDDVLQMFLESGRSGFYVAVVKEGDLTRGDRIERLAQDPHGVTVSDIVSLHIGEKENLELLARVVQVPALPARSKEHYRRRLLALASVDPQQT